MLVLALTPRHGPCVHRRPSLLVSLLLVTPPPRRTPLALPMLNRFVDGVTGRPVRGFKHLECEHKRRQLDAGMLPAHIMQLWLGELLSASPPEKV